MDSLHRKEFPERRANGRQHLKSTTSNSRYLLVAFYDQPNQQISLRSVVQERSWSFYLPHDSTSGPWSCRCSVPSHLLSSRRRSRFAPSVSSFNRRLSRAEVYFVPRHCMRTKTLKNIIDGRLEQLFDKPSKEESQQLWSVSKQDSLMSRWNEYSTCL